MRTQKRQLQNTDTRLTVRSFAVRCVSFEGAACSLQGTNSHTGQGLAETCGLVPDAKHISNPADDGVVETE